MERAPIPPKRDRPMFFHPPGGGCPPPGQEGPDFRLIRTHDLESENDGKTRIAAFLLWD